MNKFYKIALNFFNENKKKYIWIFIVYTIGIFLGVLIANLSVKAKDNSPIMDLINCLKEEQSINNFTLFELSLRKNILFAIILAISGITLMAIPIILSIILYNGLTLGYTISTITICLGKLKGVIFCFISIFAQNVIFVLAIMTIGVNSINLFKRIIKGRENIKANVIKHICISIIMIGIAIISSFIESYTSAKILQKTINYF